MAKVRGGKKLKRFLREAKFAKGVHGVEAGFYSTAKYDDGTPVTNVAAWNEFGVPKNNIPERPFFRNAIGAMGKPVLDALVANVNPRTMVVTRDVAGKVGETMQGEIQRSIVQLKEPPNAWITIHGGFFRNASGKVVHVKGKGSDNPLVDEGFMRRSVAYRVT